MDPGKPRVDLRHMNMNIHRYRSERTQSISLILIQKCKDKNGMKIRHHSMSSIGQRRKTSDCGYNDVNIDGDFDEKKSNENDHDDDKKSDKVEYLVKNTRFILNSRYTPTKIIYSCANYILCPAINNDDGKKVLVKKYKVVFDSIDESKTTLREIKLLMHFDHPDVKYTYIMVFVIFYHTIIKISFSLNMYCQN